MDDLHDDRRFIDIVLGALARKPASIAFVEGARRTTYGTALRRVEGMARVLWDGGYRPGEGFAVLTGNFADGFLACLAAQVCGGRYSALHPLASVDDLVAVVADADAKVLAFQPGPFADKALAVAAKLPGLRLLALGEWAGADDLVALASAAPAGRPPYAGRASDVAQIAYTGGTTGRPKGVVHTQLGMAANCLAGVYEYPWPETPRFLACSPITHAAGMMIAPVWIRGGTVHLLPGFDPATVVETIERERIDSTLLVPTMVYVLLDHPRLATADTSSLRFVLYGAAPMIPSRLEQAIARFGKIFMQGYGQTEALNNVVLLKPEDHDRPEHLVCAGRGILTLDVRVLDADDTPVAPGAVGEICVRGPQVMREYWKQPDLTAEALRGGWLRTGDMATMDADGFITIVDRKKDMIVSGGFNVFPKEVEDVLATHPAVALAAVIGVPDDHWGEAVKAMVVAAKGATVDPAELISLVREKKGPVYAPKSIDVVDTLPLTPIGKVDKKKLRAPFWADAERQVH